MTTLSEQVGRAIFDAATTPDPLVTGRPDFVDVATDAVLAVFEERERAIRAEYAPDVSPGDVIAAEPDGTIVLDDGITTWNPSQAAAFLLAERERLLRERIEALPHGWSETGVDDGQGHREGFEAVRWADVLGVFDDES